MARRKQADLKSKPFASRTTRYRPENAYWMAKIAELVYLKKDDGSPDTTAILDALSALDSQFENATPFNRNSSQGVVIQHNDFVVAAFRGTDEPADWLDNVNALAVEGPFGRVHGGFQRALMDIWPGMKSKIREYKKGQAKQRALWLTGHSLGGAMATLAAAELIGGDETFYGVYTFGQPRCGDRDFARIFNVEAKSRFCRFQNNNDIVTRVPARLMGYSHVGSFIYISEKGELSSDVGWWYQFVDGIQGVINDIGEKGLDAITDHAMKNYLRAIEKWGDRPPND